MAPPEDGAVAVVAPLRLRSLCSPTCTVDPKRSDPKRESLQTEALRHEAPPLKGLTLQGLMYIFCARLDLSWLMRMGRIKRGFGAVSQCGGIGRRGLDAAGAHQRTRVQSDVECAHQRGAGGTGGSAGQNVMTCRTYRPARIAAKAFSMSSRAMRRSIRRSTGSRPSTTHEA